MSRGKLEKIRTTKLARSASILRLSAVAGVKTAGQLLSQAVSKKGARPALWQRFLGEQAETLAFELGKLKGGILKAGQMLSVYGEHFFPPEVNAVLRKMQAESPPLAFASLEAILREELGPERMGRLRIDPEPCGAASLGQVHRAWLAGDPHEYVLKIQYPGVAAAIDSDLARLRTLLSLLRFIPAGPSYDGIFTEIRAMLHREVDYERELAATLDMRACLADDPRFVVPEPFIGFCTPRVLMSRYEPGSRVDGPEVASLAQGRRDRLATAALELFFQEFFVWRRVQTDPHFGNYAIRIDATGALDRWILYDFGAVREFPPAFLADYYALIHGGIARDALAYEAAALRLRIIRDDDPPGVRRALYDLGRQVLEPFEGGVDRPAYHWGASDLPQRIVSGGLKLFLEARPRAPVDELVFLDRKLAGVFTLLAALDARVDGRDLLLDHLRRHGFGA